MLADPLKTRIIAEAQIKTDKVDARILADLLRGNLISRVHLCGKTTREIKEVLRQRCFFVRQRTMMRNRIHRLLGAAGGNLSPTGSAKERKDFRKPKKPILSQQTFPSRSHARLVGR